VPKKYTKKQVIALTEKYVSGAMKNINTDVHGYRHVDRVRRWALKIGRAEGGVDLFLLEMAALLHDIGRVNETKKVNHYVAGEKAAGKFLLKLDYFSPKEIKIISKAVYGHGPGGKEPMIKILQDADRMDLWGAVAVARTFAFMFDRSFYINGNSFDFRNWTPEKTRGKFKGRPWMKSVVDCLIFNYNLQKDLNTKSAQRMATKKLSIIKRFIIDLEKETINL